MRPLPGDASPASGSVLIEVVYQISTEEMSLPHGLSEAMELSFKLIQPTLCQSLLSAWQGCVPECSARRFKVHNDAARIKQLEF